MASTRQSWQCSDSGILRKKEENEEELLVFGYSCKLFRDDEKARYIDLGKHLIPWMGDETLKIDRYDGRGALYDLRQYEPLPGGHEENFWRDLSDAERHVEQLCDEERYRAMNHNEEEEALYQEEELKRLHQALATNAYGQVAFDYDQTNGRPEEKSGGGAMETEEAEEDEAFVAPQELDIPIGMVLPETVKLNAIIEKTAAFISKQGPQMEILLKMKQASNPQFQFLSYDSVLHPYYRHLLNAIKAGRYHPQSSSQPKEEVQEDSGDDHYLHPSLAATGSRVELAPSIPSINYKPSTDCAYSMLVNRIKDKQAAFGMFPAGKSEEPMLPSMVAGIPAGMAPPVMTSVHSPGVVTHYYMTEPVISAAPVRYNVEQERLEAEADSSGPSGATVAIPTSATVVGAPVSLSPTPQLGVSRGRIPPATETTQNSNGSFHNSGTENVPTLDSSQEPTNIIMPPTDMQIIIDKMASYVAKNGQDFEAIVRSKGDSRFSFLDLTHPHNAYYRHKISIYVDIEKEMLDRHQEFERQEQAEEFERSHGLDTGGEESEDMVLQHSPTSDREDGDDDGSRKGKPAPVCFSIKKPKETEHGLLEKRSALPVEESSDEEGQEGEKNKTEVKAEKPAVPPSEATKEPPVPAPVKEEAEVIDLTDDSNCAPVFDKARWAEERLKDKLAAAAREKLAAAAREKQLQAERKRRAAAFLNMIGREHPLPKSQLIGPQLADGAPVQPVNASPKDDVDSDVSTIPSPVSTPPSPDLERIDRQDVQERLSPKHNGESRCTSSLYARIQASIPSLRKLNEGGVSRSASTEPVSHSSQEKSRRHKRKHHHEHESISPQKLEEDGHKHKKFKKKSHSRSRSHSRSHGPHSHSHHHYRATVAAEWETPKPHKKKKKKKKSHHRSSTESP